MGWWLYICGRPYTNSRWGVKPPLKIEGPLVKQYSQIRVIVIVVLLIHCSMQMHHLKCNISKREIVTLTRMNEILILKNNITAVADSGSENGRIGIAPVFRSRCHLIHTSSINWHSYFLLLLVMDIAFHRLISLTFSNKINTEYIKVWLIFY